MSFNVCWSIWDISVKRQDSTLRCRSSTLFEDVNIANELLSFGELIQRSLSVAEACFIANRGPRLDSPAPVCPFVVAAAQVLVNY